MNTKQSAYFDFTRGEETFSICVGLLDELEPDASCTWGDYAYDFYAAEVTKDLIWSMMFAYHTHLSRVMHVGKPYATMLTPQALYGALYEHVGWNLTGRIE